MKLKDMLNNKKVMSAVAVFLVILILIGTSFALSIFEKSSDANLIKTGSISMHYTESSNVINITNALPMSDRDGEIQSNYFDFSITSDAKTNADDDEGITIPYDLIIEPKAIDSDKDALTPEQIKIFLTKIENGAEETVIASTLLSNLELKETNYNLYSTENVHKNGSSAITTKYRLRAWIDYNVDAKDWNKSAKPKQYKFAINVNGTQKVVVPEPTPEPTGATDLIAKVGTGGLIAESHPATEQLQATTDYRYTGKNPDNYVSFNNELWRIIGIFDVDDGSGTIEQRIKLIRKGSIGDVPWDSNNVNDWTKATGMTLLNSGDYWNRTGNYASNGLTEEAKSQIADAKWYLGGTASYENTSDGLTRHFYEYERGTIVYEGRPTSWIGKVGLMYPSDYGYATSGGTTTNRNACLTTVLYKWVDSSASDCNDNNWLYDRSLNQWTLAPSSGYSYSAFRVSTYVYDSYLNSTGAFRPSIYLKSGILISGGSGTESDPYTLVFPEIKATHGAKTIVDKVGTDGLIAESHPATEQLVATTAYRYTGANPDNYVSFNNETWRIIGVFDVDDGKGKLEKRIKIIRNEKIGDIAWASDNVNDWSVATGMTLLNSGDYWNRTGSYASTGLTYEAKLQIADAKWYLGGTDEYNTKYDETNAIQFYDSERGTTVYTGRSTSWVGKVGLMYASDYGYATSGGATTNRDACLAKEMYNWQNSSVSDCKNNDWLYNIIAKYKYNWTLTPYSGISSRVFYVDAKGYLDNDDADGVSAFRPTVFLRSDIKITGGTGTESDPYQLSL